MSSPFGPEHSSDRDITAALKAAFERSGMVDTDHITISVSGSEVTLRGIVRSWVARDEANQAAWSVPGVTDVFDELAVRC